MQMFIGRRYILTHPSISSFFKISIIYLINYAKCQFNQQYVEVTSQQIDENYEQINTVWTLQTVTKTFPLLDTSG